MAAPNGLQLIIAASKKARSRPTAATLEFEASICERRGQGWKFTTTILEKQQVSEYRERAQVGKQSGESPKDPRQWCTAGVEELCSEFGKERWTLVADAAPYLPEN